MTLRTRFIRRMVQQGTGAEGMERKRQAYYADRAGVRHAAAGSVRARRPWLVWS